MGVASVEFIDPREPVAVSIYMSESLILTRVSLILHSNRVVLCILLVYSVGSFSVHFYFFSLQAWLVVFFLLNV